MWCLTERAAGDAVGLPEQVLNAIQRVHNGELCIDAQAMGRVFSELTAPKKPAKVNPEEAKLASLTQKERHVIRAVVEGSGAPNKTLASRLFVTEHTFRKHLTSIYQKLRMANRLELYIYAIKHQLDVVPALNARGSQPDRVDCL